VKEFYTFKKVLFPVDESVFSKRAIIFAGKFLRYFAKEFSELTILHVIRPGYLIKHKERIDLRVEFLKKTEHFKKLKKEFLNEKIKPILDTYEKILKDLGFTPKINKRVEEGEPGTKIIEILFKEDYSTVFLSRRGLGLTKSLVTGSVSTKVVYNTRKQIVYLIGEKFSEGKEIFDLKILIPVDGSEYSKKAVEHGVYLVKRIVEKIKEVKLLRVINLDIYYERLEQGIDPEKEAEEILLVSKKKFLDEYIPEKLIHTQILVGIPSEEIIKEIKENGYDLVILGRRGRSPLRDLVMGGVSSAVIYHCQEPTIVIINF